MIADDIKDLMHSEPFRPIRIVLDSERTYIVIHVDYIAGVRIGNPWCFMMNKGTPGFLTRNR